MSHSQQLPQRGLSPHHGPVKKRMSSGDSNGLLARCVLNSRLTGGHLGTVTACWPGVLTGRHVGTVMVHWPSVLNSHLTDGHVGTVTVWWPGVLNSHLTGGHVGQ